MNKAVAWPGRDMETWYMSSISQFGSIVNCIINFRVLPFFPASAYCYYVFDYCYPFSMHYRKNKLSNAN